MNCSETILPEIDFDYCSPMQGNRPEQVAYFTKDQAEKLMKTGTLTVGNVFCDVSKTKPAETKPELKPLQLSHNEIRNLKRRGWIIVPAAFMYPQMVGQPDFNGSARVKVLASHFKNLDDLNG